MEEPSSEPLCLPSHQYGTGTSGRDDEVTIHHIIRFFLHDLINDFVGFLNLGIVMTSPFEMLLPSDSDTSSDAPSLHSPDLLFVRRANLGRLTPARLIGPADLVVEIVSDHSAARDAAEKFHEYQQAGIPEYWMIDPRPGRGGGAFYHLTPQGLYAPILPTAAEPRPSSQVLPGFWLPGGGVWEKMFPTWLTSW